tara:strand:+ start:696 stop:911 length:216 start_codon:yes stop_codon:yes gene_type:complete
LTSFAKKPVLLPKKPIRAMVFFCSLLWFFPCSNKSILIDYARLYVLMNKGLSFKKPIFVFLKNPSIKDCKP